MFDTIRADLKRKKEMYVVRQVDQTWFNRNLKIYLQQGSLAVIIFRFGQWAIRLKLPVIRHFFRLIYFILKLGAIVILGINLKPAATIGKGFVIHNYSGIFIGPITAGKNLTVNQGVTIGNVRGEARRPVLGDNVYIGVSAIVLGNVKIGNNVVIGAGSLVITNVPDNCTVLGVPSRIISRKQTSPYLKFGDIV